MQKVNSEMDRYGLAKDRACNAENAATEEIDSAKRLNEEKGITILQVTHSDECAAYGDRIVKLCDYRLEDIV